MKLWYLLCALACVIACALLLTGCGRKSSLDKYSVWVGQCNSIHGKEQVAVQVYRLVGADDVRSAQVLADACAKVRTIKP